MAAIHFVREQAYLAGVSPIHESDDCLTHIARLHHPERGAGLYFVKHYLETNAASKGLANEACGWILAGAAGLPLPENPLLIELPSERIADMHPRGAARIRSASVLSWATADAGGQTLPRGTEAAAELLRRWRFLGDLIAFDSWVAIPDRSGDNLVRRRNGQIIVIDHGHLGGSVYWTSDTLPAADERRHPFLSLLWVGQIPDEVNQRIMVAAERHADCLQLVEPELNRWMEPLLGDAGDRIALLRFLQERARSNPARMKRVLNLLA